MLAVFGKQAKEDRVGPLSPTKRRLANEQTPEDEDFVAALLDNLYSSLPRRQRGFVVEVAFGGPNGIGYVESLRDQMASDADSHCYFKGELKNNPSDCEDAQYILQEYKRTWDHASLADPSPVMEALGQLEGPYAFIIYDKCYGRIVAARDLQGGEALYWGTTSLSDGLLFASDRALIEGDCVDVDDFPAGTIFVSNDYSTAGRLTPIKAEEGGVPKEMCRVESRSNLEQGLAKVESSADVAAN